MDHLFGTHPSPVFLSEHLQMQPLPLYPCLLKSLDLKCFMLLHVNDILVVCGKEYLDDCLLKADQVRGTCRGDAVLGGLSYFPQT